MNGSGYIFQENRFFNYKYAREYPGNYGTIDETWAMENQAMKYKFTGTYLYRTMNLRINYEDHRISYDDASELFSDTPYAFQDKHVIVFPTLLPFFQRVTDLYTPSSVFDSSSLVIVSVAPDRIITNTFSLLAMETKVAILTGTFVFFISALITLHSILLSRYKLRSVGRYKLGSVGQIYRKLARVTLDHIWNNSSLLFAEPIAKLPLELTPRLLTSSWLLGVSVIIIFMGCYLKNEFSVETYNGVDTLSDLISSKIKPLIIQGGVAENILQIMASEDKAIKQWFDGLTREENFCGIEDLLMDESYHGIMSGRKALIISKSYLTWLIGEVLTGDVQLRNLILNDGGFFISKDIQTHYLHIIYNATFMNADPIRKEMGHLAVYPIFECKPFAYLDFNFNYLLDYTTWKLPIKSVKNLSITDMATPFYFLFATLLSCLPLFLLEQLFYLKI